MTTLTPLDYTPNQAPSGEQDLVPAPDVPAPDVAAPAAEGRCRVLQCATGLFMKLGIRPVTMDEIARQLGMSKKTLYQFFDSKEKLVMAACREHIQHDTDRWQQIHATAASALEELITVSQLAQEELRSMNPALMYDLRQQYPSAWELFEQQHEQVIERTMRANLMRGIREGDYRAEIDPRIMARAHFELERCVVHQDLFPPDQFQPHNVYAQLIEHFVRGLLTRQGLDHWEVLRGQLVPSMGPSGARALNR